VDRIACEDTRQTQKLLNHFQIATPTVSCHQHNERHRATELIAAIKAGEAHCAGLRRRHARHQRPWKPGWPRSHRRRRAGVSHPRRQCRLSALVASGLPTAEFHFSAFCRKKPERAAPAWKLSPMARTTPRARMPQRTLIFYEAPHRILETLADLEAVWGQACASPWPAS
jgi:16S rRNA (cytidine1402-2'-O)-methyltransferase